MDKKTPSEDGPQRYDPIQQIGNGLDFLKKSNRRLAGAVVLLAFTVIAVSAVAIGTFLSRPDPTFFATSPDLRVIKLKPLTAPTLSKGGLKNWAASVATKTFTLDFLHWKKQLAAMRSKYTDNGFTSLIDSMDTSKVLEVIRKQRLVTNVTLEKAARIINTYTQNGTLNIKIEIPIIVTYYNSKGTVGTQHLVANMLIRRVPVTKRPQGVAVSRLATREAGAGG